MKTVPLTLCGCLLLATLSGCTDANDPTPAARADSKIDIPRIQNPPRTTTRPVEPNIVPLESTSTLVANSGDPLPPDTLLTEPKPVPLESVSSSTSHTDPPPTNDSPAVKHAPRNARVPTDAEVKWLYSQLAKFGQVSPPTPPVTNHK